MNSYIRINNPYTFCWGLKGVSLYHLSNLSSPDLTAKVTLQEVVIVSGGGSNVRQDKTYCYIESGAASDKQAFFSLLLLVMNTFFSNLNVDWTNSSLEITPYVLSVLIFHSYLDIRKIHVYSVEFACHLQVHLFTPGPSQGHPRAHPPNTHTIMYFPWTVIH